MLHSAKKWEMTEGNEEEIKTLAHALHISPFLAQLLYQRKMTTVEKAQSFLHVKVSDFHDPYLFEHMTSVVERIEKAIEQHEPILIYGDYDADGVSGTTILYETLTSLGAQVDYYIPDRFLEGYGPNKQAFKRAKEKGFSLIITVDNGIAGIEEAIFAKEIGIDLIITDHHQRGEVLPDAYAILHPACSTLYPFSDLCGAGVAFKLAHALLKEVPIHLLEYAMIGTICDLVPLKGENRTIVKLGLKQMRQTDKIGLKALMDVAEVEAHAVCERDIGFAIGPRINAVGRLQSALLAVDLLTCREAEKAKEIAIKVDDLNQERQMIVKETTEEAIQLVEEKKYDQDEIIVLAEEGWNPGVIGIVASRLVELYYVPVILLAIDTDKKIAKGSARSIDGFHLFHELSKCRDLIPHFGGHEKAAGMTLPLENVEELRKRLKELATICFQKHPRIPTLKIDAVLSPKEVTLSLIEDIKQLAPFGMENPIPKIYIKDATIAEKRQIGIEKNHLKILLEDEGEKLDAIGFQLGSKWHDISSHSSLSIVGELQVNEWNGNRKPQIVIDDLAISNWQLFDLRNQKNITEIFNRLPKEKVACIAFQEETSTFFQQKNDGNVLLFSQLDEKKLHYPYYFFLDLPTTLEDLQKVASLIERPERLYAIFQHTTSYMFKPLPTREEFVSYYKWLMVQKQVPYQMIVNQVKHYKAWTEDKIAFMTKVFLELGFVTIKQGVIMIHPAPEKKSIQSAPSYKKRIERVKVEQQLAYSPYHQLKKWLNQYISIT